MGVAGRIRVDGGSGSPLRQLANRVAQSGVQGAVGGVCPLLQFPDRCVDGSVVVCVCFDGLQQGLDVGPGRFAALQGAQALLQAARDHGDDGGVHGLGISGRRHREDSIVEDPQHGIEVVVVLLERMTGHPAQATDK